MDKKANIYDVAKLAGVSHQTVSRVLNNHSSLKPATREKVEEAIAQLNYRPSQAARQLVTSKSGMIGLIVVDTNLFGPTSIRNAMENEARDDGYTVTSISVLQEDRDSWVEGIEHLKQLDIDGIITVALPLEIVKTIARAIPTATLVVVDSEPTKNLDVVNIDNVEGGRIATQKLIDLGHKEILHIAGLESSYEARMRRQGYEEAMTAAKLKPWVIQGNWSIDSGYEIGLKICESKKQPTAIFCANDHQSLGLLKALTQKGVQVPQDVSVIGFDDIPEAEFFVTSLTTVKQDFKELGKIAVNRLLAQMKEPVDRETVLIKPTLIKRDSTQALKGGK